MEENNGVTGIWFLEEEKMREGEKRFDINLGPTFVLLITITIFYVTTKVLAFINMDNSINLLFVAILFIPFLLISFGMLANQFINMFSKSAKIRLFSVGYLTDTYGNILKKTTPFKKKLKLLEDVFFTFVTLYLYYVVLSIILLFLIKNALLTISLGIELNSVQLIFLVIFIAFMPRIMQLTDPKLSRRMLLAIFMPLAVFSAPIFILKPVALEYIQIDEFKLLLVSSLFILIFGDMVADYFKRLGLLKLELSLNTIAIFPIMETIEEKRSQFDFDELISIYSEAIKYGRNHEIDIIETELQRAYKLGMNAPDYKLKEKVLDSISRLSYHKKPWGKRILSILLAGLKDEDHRIRLKASSILESISDSRTIETLIKTMNNKYSIFRMEAITAIGIIGAPKTARLLPKTLRSKYSSRRRTSLPKLVPYGIEKALKSLLIALKDEDWNVRIKAAFALGELRDARAIKPLKDLEEESRSTDYKFEVYTTVKSALNKITPPPDRIKKYQYSSIFKPKSAL